MDLPTEGMILEMERKVEKVSIPTVSVTDDMACSGSVKLTKVDMF